MSKFPLSSALPALLPAHTPFWNLFITAYSKQKLGHAHLLIGSPLNNLTKLALRMAAALFCKQGNISPCGTCQACQLVIIHGHPDLIYLAPEQSSAIIKIDQIRSLPSIIFTSPKLDNNRVVIIEPAEKMNEAAANALLKILEEPSYGTYFILIAEQINTIPPTIISRCQQWHLLHTNNLSDNYLNYGYNYPLDNDKGKLFIQRYMIVDNLTELQSAKHTVHSLAVKWSTFEFNALIWLLYLINAQMIYEFYRYTTIEAVDEKLFELAKRIKPVRLFAQLDKLSTIMRNLNRALSINQLLTLEELLLGYALRD